VVTITLRITAEMITAASTISAALPIHLTAFTQGKSDNANLSLESDNIWLSVKQFLAEKVELNV